MTSSESGLSNIDRPVDKYADFEPSKSSPPSDRGYDRNDSPGNQDNGQDVSSKLFEEAYYDVGRRARYSTSGGTTNAERDSTVTEITFAPLKNDAASRKTQTTSEEFSALAFDYNKVEKIASDVFKKIDTNNDGYISTAETAAAIANPDIKNEEAVAVAMLKEGGDGIQALNNDEYGSENNGVTRADLTALFKGIKSYRELTQEATIMNYYGKDLFKGIDTDKNGFLTRDELNAYNLPKNTGDYSLKEKTAALESMKRLFDDIKTTKTEEWFYESNKGISRADMEDYFIRVYLRHPVSTLNIAKNAIYFAAESLSLKSTDKLYGTQDPLQSIQPEAVRQGRTGDCYFLGPIASMAASDVGRQRLQNMIKDNGADKNGRHTYTVTFPGAKDKPITVSQPTDSEMALYASGTRHGTWAAVLEKAYAQYVNNNYWERSTWSKQEVDYDAIDGSSKKAGHKILTATNKAGEDKLSEATDEQIKQSITNSLKNGIPVTVAANNIIDKDDAGFRINLTPANKLYRGHAYSIIGFDPKTNMVKLRNPWGNGGEPVDKDKNPRDGVDDGIFELPLSKLKDDFTRLNYAQ